MIFLLEELLDDRNISGKTVWDNHFYHGVSLTLRSSDFTPPCYSKGTLVTGLENWADVAEGIVPPIEELIVVAFLAVPFSEADNF